MSVFLRQITWAYFRHDDPRSVEEQKESLVQVALENRPRKSIGFAISEPHRMDQNWKAFKECGPGSAFLIGYLKSRADLRDVIAEYPDSYLFVSADSVPEKTRSGSLSRLPVGVWGELMEHLLIGLLESRQKNDFDAEAENYELARALVLRAGYRRCSRCGEIWHPKRPRSGDGDRCPNECET